MSLTPARPRLTGFPGVKAGCWTTDLMEEVWAKASESSVDTIDLSAESEVISCYSSTVEVGVEVNTTQATSPETTSPVYAYEEASLIEEDNGGPISRYGVYNSWTPPPRWSEPSKVFRWAEGL